MASATTSIASIDARRWLAPVLALAGAGAVALGSWLPWMSYFAGLVPLRGWIGINGRALLASGVVASGLAVTLQRVTGTRSRALTRWATGFLGFAIGAAAVWLLIGVRELTHVNASNAMLAPRAGIGLIVVLAGGAALLLAACLPDRRTRALSLDPSRDL